MKGQGTWSELGAHLTSDMIDPVSAGGQQLGWLQDILQLQAAVIEEFSAGDTSTTNTAMPQGRTSQRNNQPPLCTSERPVSSHTHNSVCVAARGITTAIIPSQNITECLLIILLALCGGGFFSAHQQPAITYFNRVISAPTSKEVDSADQSWWAYWLLRSAACERQTADSYQLQFPTGLGTAAGSGEAEEANFQLSHMVPTFCNLYCHFWADQCHCLPELMAFQMEIVRCAKMYKWPSWIIYFNKLLTLDKWPPVNQVSHGQLLSPESTHKGSHAWPKTHQTCSVGTANY